MLAIASGAWYEVMILKQREVDAISRPLSRLVARKPILHKILREYTDPVLLAGATGAVVRRRQIDVAQIRAGVKPMPKDELAEARARRATAEEVRFDQNLTADAARTGTEGATIVTPPPPPHTQQQQHDVAGLHKHEPAPVADLSAAMQQMQEASF